MNTLRDSLLTMGVRQRNWLRLEHQRRKLAVTQILQRLLFNALEADSSLSRLQKADIKRLRAQLINNGSSTKHTTRCRVSGRSHQVLRDFQLARMHAKQLMWEGRLLASRLGRK